MSDIPGYEEEGEFSATLATDGGSREFVGSYSDSDGSLIFHGPAGKGIPPGEYRLVLGASAMMSMGVEEGEEDTADPFKGDFTFEKTPFQFEIPADKVGSEHNLGTLDLDNPSGG